MEVKWQSTNTQRKSALNGLRNNLAKGIEMKVKMLMDYRGVLTKNNHGTESFYRAGEVVDLSEKGRKLHDGEGLVAAGRAKKVVVSK